jgi:excisionase family DNA binding protein
VTIQEIFRTEEVAAATAQSRSKVYLDIKSNLCPSIKIGGRRRITRAQLDLYVSRLTGEATSVNCQQSNTDRVTVRPFTLVRLAVANRATTPRLVALVSRSTLRPAMRVVRSASRYFATKASAVGCAGVPARSAIRTCRRWRVDWHQANEPIPTYRP